MNDLAAAVGLGNLEDLPANLERRRQIAQSYRDELKNISGLQLLDYKNDRESAYWLFTILVERRENFIRALKSRGVPASVVHLRIDGNSVFEGCRSDLPNQEKFNEMQIGIPLHSSLSDTDVNLVVRAVKSGW